MTFTLSENIKRLLQRDKINTSELARQVNLAQPVVHRLLSGKHKNPTLATIHPIASFFNVTISQLVGEDVINMNDRDDAYYSTNIPVVEWKNIESAADCNLQVEGGRFMSTDTRVSDEAYALVVEQSGLDPYFPKGARIVVEPKRAPQDGDFIVVIAKKGKGANIQSVVSDGADAFIKSLNPALSDRGMTAIEDVERVMGVVVQVKSYY